MSRAITPRRSGGPDFLFLDRPRIFTIRSAKGTQFTTSLAKNASEQENLTGLVSSRILITGVTIHSVQALRYQVQFFSKDSFANSDLDKDTFVAVVDLDLSTYAKVSPS